MTVILREIMNKLFRLCKFILGSLAIFMCLSTTEAMASKTNSCIAAKNDFRTLYLELQAKYLNYRNKDTTLDKNGKIVLIEHKEGTPYEGKDFELAIFKQYQNALKKVALVYQETKAKKEEFQDSYPELVGFLEAMEKEDPSPYIKDAKIDAVVRDISRMSQSKYANSNTPGHAISKSDEYLLRKLLIHAIDSICGTSHFRESGQRTKYYNKDQLERQLNAPLNRMMRILKNAEITETSDIKIFSDEELEVNGRVAVHSAIAEHMQRLAKWARENKNCMDSIKRSDFIQSDIQPCNYQRFLNSLSKDNFDELESILHFINANDEFFDKKAKLAETHINPIFLESMIDQTFSNLGDKVVCTIIPSDSGKNIVFIRNLPYDEAKNKFDTSSISCSVGGEKKSKKYCDENLTFTSNKYGNGLEIGQKNSKGPAILFSVEGDPNCNDINSQNDEIRDDNTQEQAQEEEVQEDKLTNEACQAQGKSEDPPRELTLSEDGLSCVEVKNDLLTQEICDQRGNEQDPPVKLVLSEDQKSCEAQEITKPIDSGEQQCIAKNKEWIEKENEGRPGIAYEWDGKSCVDKRPKKEAAKEEEAEPEAPMPFDLPEGPPPGRFMPLSNPSNHMYILQGWP